MTRPTGCTRGKRIVPIVALALITLLVPLAVGLCFPISGAAWGRLAGVILASLAKLPSFPQTPFYGWR